MLLTRPERFKSHVRKFHRTTSKLSKLLRRAHPEQENDETYKILYKIKNACSISQNFTPKPESFMIYYQEEMAFNQIIAQDLIYLDKEPVLHIVCPETH